MLSRIEREGMVAVRAYSERLDRWNPPSFRVSEDAIRAAAEQVDEVLREHIAFAQEQVRNFATLQRETLSELEVETRPGVTLGHRHVPVAAVGSYVPGARYPMLASAFMTGPRASGSSVWENLSSSLGRC
jgi:sulfopropanediol 3-dehydrogenase